MAITIVQKDVNKPKEKCHFPCLGVYENGMIVLFTSISAGTVLVPSGISTATTGDNYTNFAPDWEIYEGTLELKYVNQP